MLGLILIVWLTLSSFTTTWAQQDTTYPIQFQRKLAQGDHFLVETTSGENAVTTTQWQGVIQSTKTETASVVHLLAEVTMLRVDEFGQPSKEECRINSFTRLHDDGKGETPLVPPQSVIIVEGGETETTYTMDGNPVAADVKTALSGIIKLQKISRDFDEDRTYGTAEKKHVGERWSGDSKAMMDKLIGQGMAVPTAPSIDARLVAIESYNDTPCMKVHVRYEAKDFKTAKWPSEITLNHSSGVTNIDVWMPLDVNKTTQRFAKSETVRYEYEGVSQGKHYSSVQDITSEMQFRILKELPQRTEDGK